MFPGYKPSKDDVAALANPEANLSAKAFAEAHGGLINAEVFHPLNSLAQGTCLTFC